MNNEDLLNTFRLKCEYGEFFNAFTRHKEV